MALAILKDETEVALALRRLKIPKFSLKISDLAPKKSPIPNVILVAIVFLKYPRFATLHTITSVNSVDYVSVPPHNNIFTDTYIDPHPSLKYLSLVFMHV